MPSRARLTMVTTSPSTCTRNTTRSAPSRHFSVSSLTSVPVAISGFDRLDVARPAHGFLGHVLDAWHAHRWVGLGQQYAQAVSEEGLDIADARDLDDLEPRQRRDLDDLAVPDDARWPQVFVEQILGRPGNHVAIGLFRVGREATDLDVDLLGPACRQCAA